jgi:hypothetical protein
MKTRLGTYIFLLLAFPLAGLYLSGTEWSELEMRVLRGDPNIVNPPATLLTTLMMAGYLVFINHMNKLVNGKQPFKGQMNYVLAVAGGGAILVWLLVYINLYVASWASQSGNPVMQGLLYTPLFAMLAPAVLFTRAFIAALPNVLKVTSSHHTFTPPSADKLAFGLLGLGTLFLLGAAAVPASYVLLIWSAPLLLLMGLQLLWNESTVFSGLKTGDNGRLICAALAGVVVGNFALFAYHSNGGLILLESTWTAQLGMLLFGLLCMQLADVLAESWRGKKRSDLYPKKKFPIPVVVKKH